MPEGPARQRLLLSSARLGTWAAKGEVEIQVTFDIDTNGIVSVSAVERPDVRKLLLWAESQPHEGSTFTFTLPILYPSPEP